MTAQTKRIEELEEMGIEARREAAECALSSGFGRSCRPTAMADYSLR